MVASSRAQVVARRSCRVGSHCSTHSCRRISPRRGSRQVPPASATSISALRCSAYQSHLGFAVLLSAPAAIAHPVSDDDSKATRTVTPLNATPLNVSHTPIPVQVDGGQLAPPARPRRWNSDSERGGRHGSPSGPDHDDASRRGCQPAPRASSRDRQSRSVAPSAIWPLTCSLLIRGIALRELSAAVWYGCRPP